MEGLSLKELARRTIRESWEDSVFGQGGRMAFYHFLAIFPALLVFLTICASVPHLGGPMKIALQDLASQVLPDQVSQLLQQMVEELNQHAPSGLRMVSICAAALWAALNATWAMVYGLNKAYEVQEYRSWWHLWLTIAGLTLSLALTGAIAGFVIVFGAHFRADLQRGAFAVHCLEWLIMAAALYLSFALLYRFAPAVRDHEWRWSTPGALCALILWIVATLGARIYFDHVDNYKSSYGHLNGVAMLLLWLYVTNGAVLIGGEMNSEMEKASEKARRKK